MTVVLDAQCGRCGTIFTAPVGSSLQCPEPSCAAVPLLVEGQLVWVRPAEREQLAPRQEHVSQGGRENGGMPH